MGITLHRDRQNYDQIVIKCSVMDMKKSLTIKRDEVKKISEIQL